jgi:hypothetical protein
MLKRKTILQAKCYNWVLFRPSVDFLFFNIGLGQGFFAHMTRGAIIDLHWLGSGWALVGLWLGSGWALAGLWLGSGWALAANHCVSSRFFLVFAENSNERTSKRGKNVPESVPKSVPESVPKSVPKESQKRTKKRPNMRKKNEKNVFKKVS